MKERRIHKRIEKSYRVQYGPLSCLTCPDKIRDGTLYNISAGGLSFLSSEFFPQGTQLHVCVRVTGWQTTETGIEKTDDPNAEAVLKTIVEVTRITAEQDGNSYRIAAKFLGRVATTEG